MTERRTITAEELHAGIADGSLIAVMTMTPDRYEKAHIPGSIQGMDLEEAEVRYGKDAPLVVYCSDDACRASLAAYHALVDAGFTNVRHFAAGLSGWLDAGYELEGTET